MGALILSLLVAHCRRILDLAIGATFIGGSVWMVENLPLAAACSLWALLIVLAVVGLQVRDGAGGEDARLDAEDLAERGRWLASQRDDLIAQGIDPCDLLVPVHPRDGAE